MGVSAFAASPYLCKEDKHVIGSIEWYGGIKSELWLCQRVSEDHV